MSLIRWVILALLVWWVYQRVRRLVRVDPGPSEQGPHQNAEPDSGSRDPWQILGVERDASQDEIRHAFRKRMAEYHPDKVRELGSELRELADEKSKQISWAYQQLRRR